MNATEGTHIARPSGMPMQANMTAARSTKNSPRAQIVRELSLIAHLMLVNDAMITDRLLVVVTQKNLDQAKPSFTDLHEVGTLSVILRMVRTGDGAAQVLVRGLARARLTASETGRPYLLAHVQVLDEESAEDVETEGLARAILDQFSRLVAMSTQLPDELVPIAHALRPIGAMADFIIAVSDIAISERQELLEELPVKRRLERLALSLGRQLQVVEDGSQDPGSGIRLALYCSGDAA